VFTNTNINRPTATDNTRCIFPHPSTLLTQNTLTDHKGPIPTSQHTLPSATAPRPTASRYGQRSQLTPPQWRHGYSTGRLVYTIHLLHDASILPTKTPTTSEKGSKHRRERDNYAIVCKKSSHEGTELEQKASKTTDNNRVSETAARSDCVWSGLNQTETWAITTNSSEHMTEKVIIVN
jgi:hypothetical protein